MSKRAERRHHYERMKAKARRVECMRYMPRTDDRTLGIAANTGKRCSCYMCGNPRRHFRERTMRERRAAITEREM